MAPHAAHQMTVKDRGRRAVAVAISMVLSVAGLVLLDVPAAVAAGESIALSKEATSSPLVGNDISYQLTVSNPSAHPDAVAEYNLSFRDVLPIGTTYKSGSTTPSGYGEPTPYTDPDTGQQTLVWTNVDDLAVSEIRTLSFKAEVDPDVLPVGSEPENSGQAYVNSDPRFVPKFDDDGVVSGQFTASAEATASSTITAIKINKSEPSPEHELLRGVHDHTTVYTLTVTNNDINANDDTVVVDYLPAQLEFLGCGEVDNSAALEYPSAASLDATPAVGVDCLPHTATTVENPAGLPAGVYTRVEWTLGSLAPLEVVVIRYAAGIPMRRNVMPADPGSFVSTANLDNNTGGSTRETDTEQGLTNHAEVTSTYTGPDGEGETNFEVSDADSLTVTSEDVAVQKSVDSDAFVHNGLAEYTLDVQASEYVDATDIVLTDTLPNGLCPLDDVDNYESSDSAECDADAAFEPSLAYESVVDNDSAGFEVEFESFDLAQNETIEITYFARMRTTYDDGEPTSSGDNYRNTVALAGQTAIIGAQDPPTPIEVLDVFDDSSAQLVSGAPVLDKQIGKNVTPMDCGAADYTDNYPGDEADLAFAEGSRVCFKIRIDFSDVNATRDPVLADFFPDGVIAETPSQVALTANNTVTVNTIETLTRVQFVIGDEFDGHRYVAPGGVFEAILSGILVRPAATEVDVPGNLAKFRWVDRDGRSQSLRDRVDLHVPTAPPVVVDKQVALVATPGDLADSQQVVHGDTVRYQIDLTNDGNVDDLNDINMADLELWDALPPGFVCADIVPASISDAGTCTDPLDGGHPSFDGNDVLSAITWTLAGPLASGDTTDVTYDVVIPATTTVNLAYLNVAAVRTYTTDTNLAGVVAEHFPADNIDSTVPAADEDVPAAADTAFVILPSVGLTKTNTTSQSDAGNGDHDAVAGETVTYAIRATIPAHTTIYNGTLTDPLPSDLVFQSATVGYSATGADPAEDALPGGVTFDAADGSLDLGSVYTNDTEDDQVFEVTVTSRVAPGFTGTGTRQNTATFASKTVEDGILPVPAVEANSDVDIVQPDPDLRKTSSPNSTVVAGQEITYTLRARNLGDVPTLYDGVVRDCVPAGLTVTELPAPATSAAADGSFDCVAGSTLITWPVGDIAGNGDISLIYKAEVTADAAAGQVYRNVALLTGSTLDNDTNDDTVEGVLTDGATKTVRAPAATIEKTVVDPTRTVGERATYTLTGEFPADVNFYDASITDELPPGLDPASVVTTDVSCTNNDTSACVIAPSPGTPGTNLAADGSTVGWFLGDLSSSEQNRTVVITFTALVVDNCTTGATECNTAGKVRSNTAEVKWNLTNKTDPTTAGDPFDDDAESPAAVFTVVEPQVAIAKSVSDETPAPGDVFTYTVTVSNPGGSNVSDAYNVVVEDVVPVGVVVDEDSLEDGGTYDADSRTISWTIDGPLAPGVANNVVFTYRASFVASEGLDGAARDNTVSVPSFESLPTAGRTYEGPDAEATVTPAFPHVTVDKVVVGSNLSYIGEPQNFRITVTSDGDSPAYDIDVTDALPENWTYDSNSASVKVGAAAAGPLEPTDDAGNPATLTWADLAASGLPVGSTIVINYTASPTPAAVTTPGAGSANDHVNTVSVVAHDQTGSDHSDDGDYFGPPDTATAKLNSADIAIVKEASGIPVAGAPFSWTLTVSHEDGDPAAGPIVVTDDLPAGLTGISASGTGWFCSVGSGTVTCTHAGPLASGTLPVITVTGKVPADTAAGTPMVNMAEVDGHTFDPELDNNEDEVSVNVITLADLSVVKSLPAGVVEAGEHATYTLDVTNLGPSVSEGPIVVTDTLPAGTTFISASGTGWACPESGGVVTCTRAADLAPSASAGQITVVIDVPASQTDDVVNAASVAGTTDEPDTDEAEANNTDSVTTTPTREANLFLQKSLKGADPLVSGDQGTYTLRVVNNGASTATGVQITDELPSYLSYEGFSGSGWSCSAVLQLVTCDLTGSLAVGDAAASTVEIDVEVDSAHTGDIINEATATATEDPTGSTDDDINTPAIKADLQIVKSHSGDAIAGGSIDYLLEVDNGGPSDTEGPIVVTDDVPTGMTYSSVVGAGWVCDDDTGVVTCTHADGIDSGESADLTLTFAIAEDAGPADVTNRVTVQGPSEDPTPGNNADEDGTSIVDDANISVVKSASAATVDAGGNATWTIQVTNEGLSTADQVVVSDLLPAELSLVSIDGGPSWACVVASATCSRATLSTGVAPPITVVTKVGSGVASGATVENAVLVSTSTPGDDAGDNSSSDEIFVTTSADLALTKTHDGTPVAGNPFTFHLDGTNGGPSDAAPPITVEDQLPVGMTYLSANDPWGCVAEEPDGSGQTVVCTLVAGVPIVANQAVPTLALVVDIASDQEGIELTNTAAISSSTPDPNQDDNEADDAVTPGGQADLSVTKSHLGPVEVGEEMTFDVVVHNDGPSEARAVELTEAIPAGLTLVGIAGTGWTCDAEVCTLDAPLAAGDDAPTLHVTALVTPEAYPGVTNSVTVTSDTDDPDGTNNESDDPVVVPPKVDLSVVKELVGTLGVGRQGQYQLTVHNGGLTADPGTITVTDQLPDGLTYVSATADGWLCSENTGLVSCSYDSEFEVDRTDIITLTVDVGAAAYPSVSNTAAVSSPAPDVDPDNNLSTVTNPVEGSALLRIKKTASDVDGDRAVWSIVVTNSGPTESTAPIVVRDKLPRELTLIKASGKGFDCDDSRRTLVCTFEGTLAVGAHATLRVVTEVTVDDGREITNVATAEGGGPGGLEQVSDDAVVTAPGGGLGSLLPDTGGVAFWLLIAGLLAALSGAFLVGHGRKTPGRHC